MKLTTQPIPQTGVAPPAIAASSSPVSASLNIDGSGRAPSCTELTTTRWTQLGCAESWKPQGKGSGLDTKAVEGQDRGSVADTKAVEGQGRGSVVATKAVEAQGRGSVLPNE